MTVNGDRTLAPPVHSSARAWTVTAAVVGAVVVVFLDKALLGIVANPVRDELGLSSTAFGALGSASNVLQLVACLGLGTLANRVSPRLLLLVSGVLWAAGQAPAVLATTAVALVASRLVVGAAEGPVVPLLHTVAYSWFPNERRGLPASLITAGSSVAKVALLPVLTVVVVAHGWRSGFLTVGVLALVWTVVWYAVGRMGPFAAGSTPVDGSAPARWTRLLRSRTFLVAAFAYFAQGALAAVVFTWLPSYFENGLGFTATESGLLYALPSAMGIVALLGMGAIGDRMLRRGVGSRTVRGVVGGLVLAASGALLCVLPWVSSTVVAIAVLVLGYGFSVTVNTVTLPMIAEIAPAAKRAGALAALIAAGSCAGIVSPLVTGMILDSTSSPGAGYTTAFLMCGGLLVVAGLLFGAVADPERDAVVAR
jgi:MFS transporter, ACS family, hexuronate transporter